MGPNTYHQVTERLGKPWVCSGTAHVRGKLSKGAVQTQTQPRGSYPDWMGEEYEEPEKASWRQDHHLRMRRHQ